MGQFRIIISIVVLVASICLIIVQLFTPQPLQIILETGQEIVTQNTEYFSLSQVLMLVVASFLIGSTALYLYFKSETEEFRRLLGQKKSEGRYEMVIPLLKGDEREVFRQMISCKEGMLQNALVRKTGMNKVRMTRALSGLERKGLVAKERRGLTNMVRLK